MVIFTNIYSRYEQILGLFPTEAESFHKEYLKILNSIQSYSEKDSLDGRGLSPDQIIAHCFNVNGRFSFSLVH